jgi:hypothetical protein
LPAGAQTATGISVVESRVRPDFPTALHFELVAEAERGISVVELYWRAVQSPTVALEQPEIEPAERVALTHTIDMTINYLPPGVDIAYWWRIIDAAGQVRETEPQSFFYMDAEHDWHSHTEGQVTLWWYDGGDDFGDAVLASANGAIARLSERFAIETDAAYRIVVYADDADFEDAQSANSADWIGGLAYTGLDLVVAQIAATSGAREIGRMIPHEVSHLLLYRATENPYNSPPSWLDEGLAIYNQDTPDSRLVGRLNDAVEDGELMPIPALNGGFPLDSNQALLAYAESESIVEFIIVEFGDDTMARLIAVFREAVSYDDAIERSLGISIEEFDAAWKAWLDYPGDDPDRLAGPESATESGWDELLLLIALAGGAALMFLALGVAAVVVVVRARRPAE